MSVDTKAFVMTSNKNPFQTYALVKSAIKKLSLDQVGNDHFALMVNDDYKNAVCHLSDFSEMLTISFRYKSEGRQMHIHLDCDCDGEQSGYADGSKIIFSLGAWGYSVEIMEAVIKAFKHLGTCYIIRNDAIDEKEEV